MRILVIQTAFLGDMILTLPLLALIREAGIAESVCVVAAPAGARLLETQSLTDRIVTFDKRAGDRGPSGTLRIARAARGFGADVALVPHRSLRSAAIAALAAIPRRVGFDESGGRALFTQTLPYRARGHEVERVASLATPLGVELPADRVPFSVAVPDDGAREADNLLTELGAGGGLAVLAPGSRWPTKRWPAERYAELADRLAASGLTVALSGSVDDRGAAGAVSRKATASLVDLTGRLTLGTWIALVARSRIVVSNDSAAAHVAAGVGTPVVTVFGPTIPGQGFAPYAEAARVLEADLACRPCGRHGGESCPLGTLQCMVDVTVDRAHEAVLDLLGASVGGEPRAA